MGGKILSSLSPAEALAELWSAQNPTKKGPQQSPDFGYLKKSCKEQGHTISGYSLEPAMKQESKSTRFGDHQAVW